MRILIVDDQQERHDVFAKKFNGEEITHAYTHEEAVLALGTHAPYDCAYLDYDLGVNTLSGHYTAAHIASMPKDTRPKEVIVHSCSPAGARQMVQTLQLVEIKATWRAFWTWI